MYQNLVSMGENYVTIVVFFMVKEETRGVDSVPTALKSQFSGLGLD